MENTKKITKRQIQALQTKEKIFSAAKKLFIEKGISNVNISDIVHAAHVSTGTFYLYFSSKNQIISDIFLGEDTFFNQLPMQLQATDYRGKIVEYFTKSSEHIEENGLEIVRQLYFPSNPLLTRGIDSPDKENVCKLIQAGIDTGEFRADTDPVEMADFLYSISSGIIFEWCMHEGSFSMKNVTRKYITYALKAFI